MHRSMIGVNWKEYIVSFLDAHTNEFADSLAAADAMAAQLASEFGVSRVGGLLVVLETQAEFNARRQAEQTEQRYRCADYICDAQSGAFGVRMG